MLSILAAKMAISLRQLQLILQQHQQQMLAAQQKLMENVLRKLFIQRDIPEHKKIKNLFMMQTMVQLWPFQKYALWNVQVLVYPKQNVKLVYFPAHCKTLSCQIHVKL